MKIIDGIYYFDNLFKSVDRNVSFREKEEADMIKNYMEEMFDSFNKNVIYSFISYFVSNCISRLILKDLFIDIALRNFVMVRDGSNLKFVYLLTYENFIISLEENI